MSVAQNDAVQPDQDLIKVRHSADDDGHTATGTPDKIEEIHHDVKTDGLSVQETQVRTSLQYGESNESEETG